ncbi:hypothetical protein MA16_Dca017925 [Dendrobium catenatum]|uniref:Uncharacterized protein n=1 Tax=Dendrobium catenatum TaxID=906689 RepID=A0A2I0W9V0_9ASPA|nr:hypothetical protein MA16_Dca017925 [Dendrobium catenatum]
MFACILIDFIVRLILIPLLWNRLRMMIMGILLLCCVISRLIHLPLVERLVGGAGLVGEDAGGCLPGLLVGNDVAGARFSVSLAYGNLWCRSLARFGWLLHFYSPNWTV